MLTPPEWIRQKVLIKTLYFTKAHLLHYISYRAFGLLNKCSINRVTDNNNLTDIQQNPDPYPNLKHSLKK